MVPGDVERVAEGRVYEDECGHCPNSKAAAAGEGFAHVKGFLLLRLLLLLLSPTPLEAKSFHEWACEGAPVHPPFELHHPIPQQQQRLPLV